MTLCPPSGHAPRTLHCPAIPRVEDVGGEIVSLGRTTRAVPVPTTVLSGGGGAGATPPVLTRASVPVPPDALVLHALCRPLDLVGVFAQRDVTPHTVVLLDEACIPRVPREVILSDGPPRGWMISETIEAWAARTKDDLDNPRDPRINCIARAADIVAWRPGEYAVDVVPGVGMLRVPQPPGARFGSGRFLLAQTPGLVRTPESKTDLAVPTAFVVELMHEGTSRAGLWFPQGVRAGEEIFVQWPRTHVGTRVIRVTEDDGSVTPDALWHVRPMAFTLRKPEALLSTVPPCLDPAIFGADVSPEVLRAAWRLQPRTMDLWVYWLLLAKSGTHRVSATEDHAMNVMRPDMKAAISDLLLRAQALGDVTPEAYAWTARVIPREGDIPPRGEAKRPRMRELYDQGSSTR